MKRNSQLHYTIKTMCNRNRKKAAQKILQSILVLPSNSIHSNSHRKMYNSKSLIKYFLVRTMIKVSDVLLRILFCNSNARSSAKLPRRVLSLH